MTGPRPIGLSIDPRASLYAPIGRHSMKNDGVRAGLQDKSG